MKWSKKFGIALHLTDYKEGKIIRRVKFQVKEVNQILYNNGISIRTDLRNGRALCQVSYSKLTLL